MAVPNPAFPAAQLLQFLSNSKLGADEIQEYVNDCFGDLFAYAKEGRCKASTVKSVLSKQGYNQIFKQLATGLTLDEGRNAITVETGSSENRRSQQVHLAQHLVYQRIKEIEAGEGNKRQGSAVRKQLGVNSKGEATGQKIIDVVAYVATVEKLMQSSRFEDLVIAYAANLGLRATEAGYTGIIKAAKGESIIPHAEGYLSHFTGQIKKRDYDVPKGERFSHNRPTLFPADAVRELFKRLQATTEYKEFQAEAGKIFKGEGTAKEKTLKARNQFRNIWASRLNNCLKENFPASVLPAKESAHESNEDLASMHCLRSAYAALMYWRDVPKDELHQSTGMRELVYKASILGHLAPEEMKDEEIRRVLNAVFYIEYSVSTSDIPYPESPYRIQSKSVGCYESEHEWLTAIKKEHDLKGLGEALAIVHQRYELALSYQKQAIKLQRENEELKAQLAEVQGNVEVDPVQAQLAEMKEAIAALASSKAPAETQTQPEAPKAENLRTTSTAGEQWVEQVFQKVENHNDAQSDEWQKWFVTERLLADVSKCSRTVVKRWMNSNRERVEALNNRHDLKASHNVKMGKRGEKVENYFSMTRPAELTLLPGKVVAA